jgi:hypothetical protein
VLAALLHATATIVHEIGPFVPDLAARAAARLRCLEPGPPLYARLGERRDLGLGRVEARR